MKVQLHIQQGDYDRKGQAVTDFSRTLPAPQSDFARDILKNPYIFDFLGLTDDIRERELENALLANLSERRRPADSVSSKWIGGCQ